MQRTQTRCTQMGLDEISSVINKLDIYQEMCTNKSSDVSKTLDIMKTKMPFLSKMPIILADFMVFHHPNPTNYL